MNILVIGTHVELLASLIAQRERCPVVAHVGDFAALPFAANAFSAVVVSSLRADPGGQLELDELVRVLAPDGTFVALEDLDEWTSPSAIGFVMDLWHGLLTQYPLDRFALHVTRLADLRAQLSAPGAC